MGAEADRILAVGLSHHTAPVDVRERLAMDEVAVRQTLARLCGQRTCEEAFLLSTCNRVELYAVPSHADGLREYFSSFRTADGRSVDRYLYWKRGREAVEHLFSVASSLDSLVVGEPQILGQVKTAVRLAQEENALGRVLQPLTRRTLSVAKRVRSETDIGRSRVGVGNAGVDLALQIFGELKGRRAMLIGAGEMGRQVATALLNAGVDGLLVANRTYERAVELATEQGFTPVRHEEIEEYLPLVDVLISCTAAKRPVLTESMVRRAVKTRRYRPMFLVDLSVPRNIEPSVAQIEEAYLFNIDDLQRVVARGRAERQLATERAFEVVGEEATRFIQALRVVDVADNLRAVSEKGEALRQAELERSKKLLRTLDETQLAQLDALTKALVKKLLHTPTLAIRSAAQAGDVEAVETLSDPWKK